MAARKPPTCRTTGKTTFRDEIAARLALAGKVGDKGSMRAYRCEFCRRWHTTSQPLRSVG